MAEARGKRRPTLTDVAAASGVSRATAGFVLSEDPGQSFSAATTKRVRQAADRLGYMPHGIARALREGTSRVVLLDVDGFVPGEPLRRFIDGMRIELAQHDHVLLVRPADSALDSRVDAALHPRAVVRPGEGYTTDAEPDDGGWVDGLAAHGLVQIQYLVDAGHGRLAVAVDKARQPFADIRERLARAAAERCGLLQVPLLDVTGDRVRCMAALDRLRKANPAVTAIAAMDDEAALRVLAAMRDLGLDAPEDLAVIGFGATVGAAFAVPALTTVWLDAAAYGKRAACAALGLPVDTIAVDPARVEQRYSA